MKNLISYCVVLSLCISAISCNSNKAKYEDPISKIDWSHREIDLNQKDSLIAGTSYLSVYSQIYSYTEHTSIDLTATISIRNPNIGSPAYLLKADYFDTKGNKIHSYVDNPIALSPMETLEIVIAEFDKKGGTGANFIFEWAVEPNSVEPIFESVMISTYGQQGLSFTTQGHRIK